MHLNLKGFLSESQDRRVIVYCCSGGFSSDFWADSECILCFTGTLYFSRTKAVDLFFLSLLVIFNGQPRHSPNGEYGVNRSIFSFLFWPHIYDLAQRFPLR